MNWNDSRRALYNHSCRSMHELADNSIQCCVTSPPYWGLRKYKGEQDSVWGGQSDCKHEWVNETQNPVNHKNPNRGPNSCVGQPTREANEITRDKQPVGNTCSLCGAWRGAYGLEPTVELYVAHSIEILREIRRVLRKDGVVFWNIGDTYSGSGQGKGSDHGKAVFSDSDIAPPKGKQSGIKPKDLCLIPFRVALAAQADGWWVRSDIIWNKPNPMPESVTDRPTDSYEHIFLFTKSAKYYWDMEAVREKADYDGRKDTIMKPSGKYLDRNHMIDGANANSAHSRGCERWPSEIDGEPARNLRNVWTFPTQPYKGAHFATFPEALPERCIKAGTPEVGCCSKCGTPWERIVERKSNWQERKEKYGAVGGSMDKGNQQQVGHGWSHDLDSEVKTLGWKPGCECNAEKVPSIVLDPFCGSGTTLEVAAKLGRKAVGYEISEEYCRLIVERNRQGVFV